jgi:hypothetical protein
LSLGNPYLIPCIIFNEYFNGILFTKAWQRAQEFIIYHFDTVFCTQTHTQCDMFYNGTKHKYNVYYDFSIFDVSDECILFTIVF